LVGVSNPMLVGVLKNPWYLLGFQKPLVFAGVWKNPRYWLGFQKTPSTINPPCSK